MISLKDKVLRSKRLEYRLLCEEDKPALKAILADRSVTAPAGFLPAKTDAEFDVFFSLLTQYNTAVAILKGGDLIGYIRVNRYVSDQGEYVGKSCVGAGFVIGKAYQNHGYATEALECMTDYLKGIFDHCFADHFKENIPSRRVIEKCGYKFLEPYSMFFEELGEEKTCLSYVI